MAYNRRIEGMFGSASLFAADRTKPAATIDEETLRALSSAFSGMFKEYAPDFAMTDEELGQGGGVATPEVEEIAQVA